MAAPFIDGGFLVETHDLDAAAIAIVSDTHGSLDRRVARQVCGADVILHAGDIGNSRVIRELRESCDRVFAVAGNNDRAALWPDDDSELIHSIPHCLRFRINGDLLAMEHGHRHGQVQPCHESMRRAHADARLVIYGHTHKLTKDTTRTPWVVNPGAAGSTRTHGGPSCAFLFVSDDTWSVEHHRFALTPTLSQGEPRVPSPLWGEG